MGAGRYVGRVGGLAVALGIGTAVFTGHGMASATTDSDASTTSSDTDSGQTTHDSPSPRPAVESTVADAEGELATRPPTPSDTPRQTAAGGRHRVASDTTPRSTVAAQTNSGNTSKSSAPKHAADDASEASEPSDVTSPPRPKHAFEDAAIAQPKPRPKTKPVDPTTIEVAGPTVPISGSDDPPTEPTRDGPEISTLLAGARRELVADSTVSSLIAPVNPTAIQYAPTLGITDNVITGTNTAATTINGNPITYYVVKAPSDGGKMGIDSATGNFAVLPHQSALASGSETYSVLAAETTPFDAALTGIPILGSALVQPILLQLYQMPGVNVLLAPVIGTSTRTPVTITPSALNVSGDPLAFTVMVTSPDGTKISMNYFPKSGLTSQQTAPTIFNGSGAATPSIVNPYLPNPEPVQRLRDAGYNVVTWDPRGEYYSGGLLQLDNAQFEGRDVSAMIDYVAGLSTTQLDGPGDPRMGMIGLSYGGAIQLVTAATDSRVDAIAPQIAFNNLQSVLSPYDGAARTSYALLLLLNFIVTGARVNPALAPGIVLGALTGQIPAFAKPLVDNAGPGTLAQNIKVPTLLIQGIPDPIFPLEQSLINARLIEANGAPLKMIWYCGGHGTCLTPPGDDPDWVYQQTLDWMDKYVKGEDVDTGPAFRWVDQSGAYYSSNVLPTRADFYGTSLVTTGSGGLLPIVPVIGGSGPSIASIPYSLGDGSPARNTVNVAIANPTETTQVVGAPTLTMTYSGLGTGKVVYGQIVDRTTGLVVGNQVSPVPVTLDGKQHTVSVPLADVVYTMGPDSDLQLQIVSFATAWASFTQFGAINVESVRLELPTAANATADLAAPASG